MNARAHAHTRSRGPWDWVSRYISSLYFIYSTVTTVGYGDIVATTVYERCAGPNQKENNQVEST